LVNEGVKGLYKGISAPLATVAVFNAVLFASRGQMEVLLKHKDGEQRMFC
jgi:solute carrier family 25 carnitine/acylcarnitine transporter 20/29